MKTERQLLREKRRKLVTEINRINLLLTQKYKTGIEEALKKEYRVCLQKKGKSIGCRIYLPYCLANKIVRLKLVKEKQK